MTSSFENYKNIWKDAVNKGYLRMVAISGMDGTGKGTLVNLIPKFSQKINSFGDVFEDNADVLVVQFPDYKTKIGIIIQRLLHEGAHKFVEREEMMALFAINRLEILSNILLSSYNSLQQERSVRVLFDRFSTCNLVTLGAWIANTKKGIEILSESNKQARIEVAKFMLNLENFLYDTLMLESAQILVPMVSPRTSIEAIRKDITRNVIDTYETLEVQEVVNQLFKIFAKEKIFPFEIIEQENNGTRLNPESVAHKIIIASCTKQNENSKYLELERNVDSFLEVEEAIEEIFLQFSGLKSKLKNLI